MVSQDRPDWKPFEADLLEQPAVVGDGPAPFMVVIVQIIGQVAVPEAARDAVRTRDQAGLFSFHREIPFVNALLRRFTVRFTRFLNRPVTTSKGLPDKRAF